MTQIPNVSDPLFTILDSLRATESHPERREQMKLFGQFIGVWEMDVSFFDRNQKEIYRQKNEWRFSWILDGWMIQDVLIGPHPKDLSVVPGSRRIGTSLRLYDSKKKLWRVSWFGAVSGIVVHLEGGESSNGIELRGIEDNGNMLRWRFSEIRPNSFLWTGHASDDQGKGWFLEQQMMAKRHPQPTPLPPV